MGLKATLNALVASTTASGIAVYGSTLTVQAGGRLNVSIKIGPSLIQDPTQSTTSALVHLQRRMKSRSSDDAAIWRDVESWSILAADGLDAGSENITTQPEPETVDYRIGCKEDNFYGAANSGLFLRIGSGHGEVK